MAKSESYNHWRGASAIYFYPRRWQRRDTLCANPRVRGSRQHRGEKGRHLPASIGGALKESTMSYKKIDGRKKYQQRVKIEVFSYYSNGTPECAHCGITDIDILCIDHINGGGNTHKKSLGEGGRRNFYWWLRREGFPEGYQVLCRNCNWKKRIQQREN